MTVIYNFLDYLNGIGAVYTYSLVIPVIQINAMELYYKGYELNSYPMK